jgi:hypothetical protein
MCPPLMAAVLYNTCVVLWGGVGWGSQYGIDFKVNGVRELPNSEVKTFNLTCTVCAKISGEKNLPTGSTHIVHCQVLPDGKATGYRDIEDENPHLHALSHTDLAYLGSNIRPPKDATPQSVVRAFFDSIGDAPVPQAITRYLFYKLEGVRQMIGAFNKQPPDAQDTEETEEDEEEEEDEDEDEDQDEDATETENGTQIDE